MYQHFLDVVAEYKQGDHVSKYVHEIDMEELIGDQGERRPKSANGVSSQCKRIDSSDTVDFVHLLGTAAHLHEEYDEICDHQEPHHVRRRRPPERAVIP